MNFKLAIGMVLALAACEPLPPDNPPPGAAQPGDLTARPGNGGLVEREPDLCKAADFQQVVGQPGTIVATLGITRPLRVIKHGDIITQEYNPARINFWLGPSGRIQRITCG